MGCFFFLLTPVFAYVSYRHRSLSRTPLAVSFRLDTMPRSISHSHFLSYMAGVAISETHREHVAARRGR